MRNDIDLLVREIASEIGGTVEEAVAVLTERGREMMLFGIRQLEDRGLFDIRTEALRRSLGGVSFVLPVVAGRLAGASSLVAIEASLGLLRRVRRTLAAAR